MRWLVPIAVTLSLGASVARADVTRGEPAICPRGTVAHESHFESVCLAAPPAACPAGSTPRATRAGPLCVVVKPCMADTCGTDEVCREAGLCVATVQVPVPNGETFVAAKGACGPEHRCPDGSSCEVALRCEPASPPPQQRRACDCARPGAVGMDPRPGVALTVALGLAFAWRRRK